MAAAVVKKLPRVPTNRGMTYKLKTPRQRIIDLATKELDLARKHHAKAKQRFASCPHKRALDKAESAIRDAENVLAALGVDAGPKPTLAAAGIQPRFDKCPNCGRSKIATERLCQVCQASRRG